MRLDQRGASQFGENSTGSVAVVASSRSVSVNEGEIPRHVPMIS